VLWAAAGIDDEDTFPPSHQVLWQQRGGVRDGGWTYPFFGLLISGFSVTFARHQSLWMAILAAAGLVMTAAAAYLNRRVDRTRYNVPSVAFVIGFLGWILAFN